MKRRGQGLARAGRSGGFLHEKVKTSALSVPIKSISSVLRPADATCSNMKSGSSTWSVRGTLINLGSMLEVAAEWALEGF